jgi:hypothetical protein
MRQRDPRRRAEPPEDAGPGALTAAELAEGFVTTMLDTAREAEIDPGDTAAMAALDLICCLTVYGRAPLATVLNALAKAAPARIALVKDANKRNQLPPVIILRRRADRQRGLLLIRRSQACRRKKTDRARAGDARPTTTEKECSYGDQAPHPRRQGHLLAPYTAAEKRQMEADECRKPHSGP